MSDLEKERLKNEIIKIIKENAKEPTVCSETRSEVIFDNGKSYDGGIRIIDITKKAIHKRVQQ